MNNIGQKIDEYLVVILDAVNSPQGAILADIAVGVAGVANPLAGIAAGSMKGFTETITEIKAQHLLDGISHGTNMKDGIEDLRAFVQSGESRAYTVADMFNKAYLAQTPEVCTLLGIILSNHSKDKTDFSRDELIVCSALASANDYDLSSFHELMTNCIEPNGEKTKIKYDALDSDKQAEYDMTSSWAYSNRLFSLETSEVQGISFVGGKFYYAEKPAFILQELIEQSK